VDFLLFVWFSRRHTQLKIDGERIALLLVVYRCARDSFPLRVRSARSNRAALAVSRHDDATEFSSLSTLFPPSSQCLKHFLEEFNNALCSSHDNRIAGSLRAPPFIV
jgi:hypothetical protein